MPLPVSPPPRPPANICQVDCLILISATIVTVPCFVQTAAEPYPLGGHPIEARPAFNSSTKDHLGLAHSKHTTAGAAKMCGVGGLISDTSGERTHCSSYSLLRPGSGLCLSAGPLQGNSLDTAALHQDTLLLLLLLRRRRQRRLHQDLALTLLQPLVLTNITVTNLGREIHTGQ
jgi:hypothetical protein